MAGEESVMRYRFGPTHSFSRMRTRSFTSATRLLPSRWPRCGPCYVGSDCTIAAAGKRKCRQFERKRTSSRLETTAKAAAPRNACRAPPREAASRHRFPAGLSGEIRAPYCAEPPSSGKGCCGRSCSAIADRPLARMASKPAAMAWAPASVVICVTPCLTASVRSS